MRPSEPPESTPRWFDWQGWLALSWALVFGALWARMMLDARGPLLIGAIRKLLGR
jgi:hypothetical protein